MFKKNTNRLDNGHTYSLTGRPLSKHRLHSLCLRLRNATLWWESCLRWRHRPWGLVSRWGAVRNWTLGGIGALNSSFWQGIKTFNRLGRFVRFVAYHRPTGLTFKRWRSSSNFGVADWRNRSWPISFSLNWGPVGPNQLLRGMTSGAFVLLGRFRGARRLHSNRSFTAPWSFAHN